MTTENTEIQTELKEIQSKWKWTKTTTFERENLYNFEKIHSIGSEMTGENAEFSCEYNEIQLKIQIEVKIGEEKEQHLKKKIWQICRKFHNFRGTKFPQLEFKW